jgi:hypothetical protein
MLVLNQIKHSNTKKEIVFMLFLLFDLKQNRGGRTHKGIDLVCPAGSAVKAPFAGRIVRTSRPYTDPRKAAINNGIVFSSSGRESGPGMQVYDSRIHLWQHWQRLRSEHLA